MSDPRSPGSAGTGSPRADTIEAAIFDFGGVLTSPVRTAVASWANAEGVVADSFFACVRAWLSRDAPAGNPVHRLETGELTVEEFNRELAVRLETVDGRAVAPEGLLDRLFAGMDVDPSMVELVRQLRAAGVRTALLSNSWGNNYPRDLLAELFELSVISGDVGLRKPDPRIYQLTLDRLGLPAGKAVFIDDGWPNVDAATAIGLHAFRHTDVRETRAWVAELVPMINAG